MKQETFFFRLEVLSPLHIGCDEDYEPTNFVVDEKTNELINFNPFDFISRLDHEEKTEFCRICDLGTVASLLDIFKFMHRHADKAKGRRVQVGAGFLKHYASTLQISGRDQRRLRNELNQFRIERTAFQPLTGIPYIPGSAIKGALRTALLNLRKPNRTLPTRDLEKDIFDGGSFATDPMRLVKVSDFIAEKDPENRIVYAVNKKKKPSKFDFSAPYQILEIVKPGASFIGSVSIVSPEGERGEIPRNPVTMPELKNAVDQFFLHEKERENREMKVVGLTVSENQTENKKLLLRVGRHSGAESLTIAGYRNIKIMQGRGNPQKYLDHSTTFWLTSDHKKPSSLASLQPFGWLSATPLSSAELASIKEEAEKQREVEKQEREIMIQQRQIAEKERLVREQALAEEERRAATEQQAREDQEVAKKESWESLSSEKQDLLIVSGGDLAREFAPDQCNDPYSIIWPKLDTADPEQQKALALVFKERWQKENKWKVGKKKKQYIKVQQVKAILGEA